MSTLKDMSESELGVAAAVHLLLCGPSKVGKTKYIADWILDGGHCLYVDNDNGLNTLYNRLKHDQAALARVLYIPTKSLYFFMTYFFARKVLIWNKTRDDLYQPSHDPDDQLVILKISEIPFGVLFAFDSWTSACLTLVSDSADKNSVEMESFNEKGQAVYGDAGRRANVLLSLIQAFKGHVVVQAHPDFYERMEKPKGVNNVKQKDMIIKENVQIPSSVSRPHGFQMAKYFNEFGWIYVSPTRQFKLDYRQMPDRVGGGTLMKEGDPETELRLSKTLIPPKDVGMNWFRSLTVAEYKAEQPVPAAKPVVTPAKAAPMIPEIPGATPMIPEIKPTGVLKPAGGLLAKK